MQFVRLVIQNMRKNEKLKNYIFLRNTQGLCIILMPFLVLYAKEHLGAESRDIGNFLLLKVIGGVLTGGILYTYANKIKYNVMLIMTSILGVLIPVGIISFPGALLFPSIFLAAGLVFAMHDISISGILLEVTTNENRAVYAGISGAGSIFPVVFPFLGGWIVTESGFNSFFLLLSAFMLLSFYFIWKLKCKK